MTKKLDENDCFFGFMDCLVEMWQDLEEQGYHFVDGKIVDPQGKIISRKITPKYTPYKIENDK